MDARSIGLVRTMRDIKVGQLILFTYKDGVEPGIVVEPFTNARAILHISAVTGDKFIPRLYEMEHSYNEAVILIENARIVPVFSLEHTGIGRYHDAPVSRALYVNEDGVYLTALFNQTVYTFNLFDGKRAQVYTDKAVYTKFWYIEVPDSAGDFERYLEFEA
ncbi:hypothetical protein [Methylobacterium sp. SD21]|uniref:hypothetical protein n=1 Tax=Methylobacterium litchii TaxID=3138810 RepID=UPI00313E0377